MAGSATVVEQETFESIIGGEVWEPVVLIPSATVYEHEVQLRSAQFIGSVVLDTEVSREHIEVPRGHSLLDAIKEAAEGDEEARAMVRLNVATDVVERTIKSGHVISVELEVDDQGEILQYGQTATDIQKNSLLFGSQHPEMIKRTNAEARNKFRIGEAYQQGLLEDFNAVVFSRASTNMTEAEMQAAGFFTDTMSCAIQVTSLNDGKLNLESAFVAGKKIPDEPRHDAETIAKVGDKIGVNLDDMDDVELIDMLLLVPKSMMPNGVIDIVKLYDDSAGGTFFGEDKPRQDYISYRQQCEERELSYAARIDSITEQLIEHASELNTPQEACRLLNKLSAGEMIEQSVIDTRIDPSVFGAESAHRIEHARHYLEMGEITNAQAVIAEAKRLDTSSSCPGGVNDGLTKGSDGEDNNSSSDSELDDCEFISKECPKCHKKNVKTVVKSGRYYGACGCHS